MNENEDITPKSEVQLKPCLEENVKLWMPIIVNKKDLKSII